MGPRMCAEVFPPGWHRAGELLDEMLNAAWDTAVPPQFENEQSAGASDIQ